MTAREKLIDQFEALTPRMQAAARFVIDHPNEVVISSMRTIAQRCQSQPATLVRLAQHLGYDGWPQLKAAFAGDMGLHEQSYGERARNVSRKSRNQDLISELFAIQRNNLDVTERDAGQPLREAAKALRRAKNVHVAGFRASLPIAYSIFYGYRLLRNSVQLLDGFGTGIELQLRAVEKGDAVIVTSFSPYSREALLVANYASCAGATLIAFTDSAASPLALHADVTLQFSVASPSFFPSIAAGIALAEALLEQLVAASPQLPTHLEKVEQQLFESGAYVTAPSKRYRS